MLPLTAKSFSPRYESPKICDPYFGHCLSLTAPPLCSLDIIHHTSHIIHHTSHIIYHTSFTHHTSHITHHTSYIIHHTSHVIHHTSHITHHTSHITHHTSHTTHHKSQLNIEHSRGFHIFTSFETCFVFLSKPLHVVRIKPRNVMTSQGNLYYHDTTVDQNRGRPINLCVILRKRNAEFVHTSKITFQGFDVSMCLLFDDTASIISRLLPPKPGFGV